MTGSEMQNNNPFIGTWKRISQENSGSDGEESPFPLGRRAELLLKSGGQG